MVKQALKCSKRPDYCDSVLKATNNIYSLRNFINNILILIFINHLTKREDNCWFCQIRQSCDKEFNERFRYIAQKNFVN